MKKLIYLSVMLAMPFSLFSQTNKPIPPSPSVVSLLQYSQVPVSNYTGLPNVNIPLYSIHSGSLELPISLSYHGAIKAKQEASNVGLGWALSAGGVVGREIRGKDDLSVDVHGYYQIVHPMNFNFNGLWLTPQGSVPLNQAYLRDFYTGDVDGEPDVFSF